MLIKPIMDTTINTRLNRSFGAFGSLMWWGNSGFAKESFLDSLAKFPSIAGGKSPEQPEKPIKTKKSQKKQGFYHDNSPAWSFTVSPTQMSQKRLKCELLYSICKNFLSEIFGNPLIENSRKNNN